MAEHEKVNKGKNGGIDHKHSIKQTNPQHVASQNPRVDDHYSSLQETPFYPKMDEHGEALSRIPFAVQRQEYVRSLNNSYGLRYVQRLLESVNAQAKMTVSDPNDVNEQEADRVAEQVTGSNNNASQRQVPEEDEEIQMQEEEENMVQGNLDVERQTLEEDEELVQDKSGGRRQANKPMLRGSNGNEVGDIQRHCWQMNPTQENSFTDKPDDLYTEARPHINGGDFYRFQEDNSPSQSSFYAPLDDRVQEAVKDGIITPEERANLAVLHQWVPRFNWYAEYSGGQLGYIGSASPQQGADNEFLPGGADQVVFPVDENKDAPINQGANFPYDTKPVLKGEPKEVYEVQPGEY